MFNGYFNKTLFAFVSIEDINDTETFHIFFNNYIYITHWKFHIILSTYR